ncbi:MAG: 6-bladed beta-propeller [Dysgonamonadaceae bacterium]|jgi:hypothetical protein|nr:6-bladed beta-propeller [Dysgonamonadaceae bacterium]
MKLNYSVICAGKSEKEENSMQKLMAEKGYPVRFSGEKDAFFAGERLPVKARFNNIKHDSKIVRNVWKTMNFCLLSVFLSCGHADDGAVTLDIDEATENGEQIRLSSIGRTIKYVGLETKDDCLLNEDLIVFIGLVKNNLLIADLNGCYLFNMDGKFIKQVGNKGNGPGEYGNIGNVVYDEKGNRIMITSTSIRRGILAYDENGDYIETFLNQVNLSHWAFLNNETIALNIRNYMGNGREKLAFISLSGDTLSTVPNFDLFNGSNAPLSLNDMAIFYPFKDKVYYNRMFNDTIYYLDKNYDLNPQYIFLSSKHKMESSIRADAMKFVETTFDYILPWQIIETDKYLFVNMLRNKRGLKPYFYDKGRRKFVSVANADSRDSDGFVNDLDNGVAFYPQYKIRDKTLCMVLSPTKIIELKEQSFLSDMFLEVNEDSNPVIAIVELI